MCNDRLTVKFCKWAEVPPEPLTVDVVLEVLDSKELIFCVSPSAGKPRPKFSAWGAPCGEEWCAPTPLLALLRALDAAGVMDSPPPDVPADPADCDGCDSADDEG